MQDFTVRLGRKNITAPYVIANIIEADCDSDMDYHRKFMAYLKGSNMRPGNGPLPWETVWQTKLGTYAYYDSVRQIPTWQESTTERDERYARWGKPVPEKFEHVEMVLTETEDEDEDEDESMYQVFI